MPPPPSEETTPAPMQARARAGKAWLFEHALPIWWERGYDPAARAFHETVLQDGTPHLSPRRVRVQSRQVVVYVRAGRLGWPGPWRAATAAGLEVLLERGLRADGAPVHALGPDGAVLDERPDLYDLAFALLALAEAAGALQDRSLIARADQVLDWLDTHWRLADGGYDEGLVAPTPPRRQNPHMHLFEAMMALAEVSGERAHLDRARGLLDLFTTRLLDPKHGFVPEFFDAAWRPIADDTQAVEPGHQFEWSWLLRRWRELTGDASADPIAARLLYLGEQSGVDPTTGAVYDALARDRTPRARTSRLWTHTERIKANALALTMTGDQSAAQAACAAFDVMMRYCGTAVPGLWRDRMTERGDFIEEPAPASTFYHIIMALAELIRASQAAPAK